ncbi:hypothetical protein GIB67_018809 [Kingdonia uniflora]|uniref:RING-type E3 ubiquitin transferase n=1 Tax=Kingdonia uniflora TaxID=39325 RepID=A0A7J7NDW2_9MAGN|nr:hypothetical protein GIB67_018809 [Kingdonia uniflora]
MATKDYETPQRAKDTPNHRASVENAGSRDAIISPRFRTVAELAGWDEEAILLASIIVEDTPDRGIKQKRRVRLKTSPTNSRRKRRVQTQSSNSIPIVTLDLDDDVIGEEETDDTKNDESKTSMIKEKVAEKVKDSVPEQIPSVSSSSALPCMDRLREELSCAICLEICFEPSTTPCGHSFCKKCLKSAADKCGKKCPKCRQLISNGRHCTINTVLWNTIQLLFPQEIKERKSAAAARTSLESEHRSLEKEILYTRNRNIVTSDNQIYDSRNRSIRTSNVNGTRIRGLASQAEDDTLAFRISRRTSDVSVSRRRGLTSQAEDAALALRLQREEFMEAFSVNHDQIRTSISSARENLREMASRAATLRDIGGRTSRS